VDIAKQFLNLAATGVVVTPEAKQTLQGIIAKAPLTEEATVPAIPTTLPKKSEKKSAPAKKAAPQKLSELPTETPKKKKKTLDEVLKAATPELKEAVKEAARMTIAEAAKAESKPAQQPDEDETDIVTDARAEAEKMISEAKSALEEATAKAEEKKSVEAAKAEAKKIIEKAKAEVAKIKAQIAKLGKGKSSRKAKTDGETPERTPRGGHEDIDGKKIVKVNEPVVREDSATGQRTMAVYNSKSVKAALEYEGVNRYTIRKLVDKGHIELVD
jgi:hypothetical protein